MDPVRFLKRFKTWSPWQLMMAIAATLAGLSILGGSAYLVTSLTNGALAPEPPENENSERLAGPMASPAGEGGAFKDGPGGGTGGNSGRGFAISCSPGRFPAGEGNAGGNTCTVKSTGGFSEAIDLSCANLPPSLTCEFSPISVTPPRDGFASTRLQLWWDNLRPGNYNFRVVGRSGRLTNAYTFPFRKTDSGPRAYALNCPQTGSGHHIQLLPGQAGGVACTVASQGGFSGPVMLGCTRAGGVECNFGQNRVFLQPFGQADANLTVSVSKKAAPGVHELFVQTHSPASDLRAGQPYRVLVEVPSTVPPSFRLECDQTAISIVQGTSGSLSCRVRSVNFFEGEVTLTLAHQTAFVPYSLNPPAVRLTPNAPVPVTFTLDATNLAPGKYGLYLSATSPDQSAGTQLELSVTPAPPPPPTSGPPPEG
jgi:hypothetical protein